MSEKHFGHLYWFLFWCSPLPSSPADLSYKKLLHHTCLQSILKLHCKVDYLQQLFGTEFEACLFFLKTERTQVPPLLLSFRCVKGGPILYPFFFLEPFITFLQGVKEQDTSLISTPNNLVCLVSQFYFCMIDSWYCAWFISWYYLLNHVFHGQFLISVFPSSPHYSSVPCFCLMSCIKYM